HVETFRNPLDRLILKNGEIQVRNPRPGQEVATGTATKVETRERRQPGRRRAAIEAISRDAVTRPVRVTRVSWIEPIDKAGWRRIAVRVPKGQTGGGRDGKALGLDVVAGISGIGKCRATGSVQPIRESPVVAVREALRIATGSPGRGKGNAIT